jgi:hypothetical protein
MSDIATNREEVRLATGDQHPATRHLHLRLEQLCCDAEHRYQMRDTNPAEVQVYMTCAEMAEKCGRHDLAVRFTVVIEAYFATLEDTYHA